MTGKIRSLAIALLFYYGGLLFSAPAAAQENREAKALSSVGRLEIIVDHFSAGPSLLQQISFLPEPTPYENELARRLRQGASGSAFCVAPGYFLTTAHIILVGARYGNQTFSAEQWASLETSLLAFSKPQITLNTAPGPAAPLVGRVVAIDRNDDLALLYFPETAGKIPALTVGEVADLAVGAPVTALGYSEAGLQISRGNIESLIRGATAMESGTIQSRPGSGKTPIVVGKSDGAIVRLQHSAAVASGMSGGPLLNESGQVVGISYGMLKSIGPPADTAGKIYLAVSAVAIKKLLSDSQGRLLSEADIAAEIGARSDVSPLPPAPYASSSPPSPAAASLSLVGPEALESMAFDIRHNRAGAALPALETRLRRNRFDYYARALLVQAHYQESLYPAQTGPQLQAAYYQSAWLAYFAPELEFARPAEKFLEEQQHRVAPYLASPGAKNVFLASLARKLLFSTVKQGRVGQLLPNQFSDLLQQGRRLETLASSRDPVTAAALIQLYLAQEQAWELADPLCLNETSKSARRQLLSQALTLALPLSAQLEAAPGGKSLLAYVYVRLSRLESPASPLLKARQELANALRLDPTSPRITEALSQLGQKP